MDFDTAASLDGREIKYAGSLAEGVFRRLDSMDVINQGMLFAATLLLCLFPFPIVVTALAGRSVVNMARYTGLNRQAAAGFSHLLPLRRRRPGVLRALLLRHRDVR